MTEDFTRPAGDPRTLGQDPAGTAPVGPPPVTPPPPAGAPTPVSTGPVEDSGSQGGTGDKAKQEAANVASNAKEQASEVAGSAKEQASEVAGNAKEQAAKVAGTAKEETQRTVGEAKRQAQDLLRQSQSELSSQAGVQQQRLAETLRSFSGELGQMADSSEEPGLATQVARWASQVSDDAGRWLEDRDPSSVFDEVRRYARRSPGTFMLIAAGLGLAVRRVAPQPQGQWRRRRHQHGHRRLRHRHGRWHRLRHRQPGTAGHRGTADLRDRHVRHRPSHPRGGDPGLHLRHRQRPG